MAFDLATAKPVSGFDLATAAPVDEAPANEDGYAMRILKNVPHSAGEFAKGIYQAVRHPLDTGMTALDAAAGGLQNLMPESVVKAADSPNAERARTTADAIGHFYKQRYGSAEGFAKAIETDPVGVLADVSTVVTGGGTLAAKVPGLLKAGEAVANAGKAMAPLNVVGAAIKPVANLGGKAAASVIGGLGTHTGAESIKGAFGAGREGGTKGQVFLDNMRGNVPMEAVLDEARAAVDKMRQERSAAYKQGMAGVSQDKTVLDLTAIQDAVRNQAATGTYKGKIINKSTYEVQDKIRSLVDDWAKSDPAEFHTPEGLDALKKAVGDIRDSTDFGTPSRKVADSVYHAVKNEITQQAPDYAKVMKDYEAASELVKEVEKGLLGGNKATADTALRRLQSVMRNNANTNYGNRLDMAKQLEQAGAKTLLPALAGQALNSAKPRGLGGALSLGVGGGLGFTAGGPLGAAAALGVQSPRLMGEASYYAGKAAGGLDRGMSAIQQKIDPAVLADLLFQLDQQRYQ